jgi:hypothetical protein
MAVLKPRNRVLLFRLTQEEYDILQSACVERGGRNLSDFIRSSLLLSLSGRAAEASLIQEQLKRVDRKISELRRALDRMAGELEKKESMK